MVSWSGMSSMAVNMARTKHTQRASMAAAHRRRRATPAGAGRRRRRVDGGPPPRRRGGWPGRGSPSRVSLVQGVADVADRVDPQARILPRKRAMVTSTTLLRGRRRSPRPRTGARSGCRRRRACGSGGAGPRTRAGTARCCRRRSPAGGTAGRAGARRRSAPPGCERGWWHRTHRRRRDRAALPHPVADPQDQLGDGERLHQVVRGAELEAADPGLGVGDGGQHQDPGVRVARPSARRAPRTRSGPASSRSRMIRSGSCSVLSRSPVLPSCAVTTVWPSASRARRTKRMIPGSSSMTRILPMVALPHAAAGPAATPVAPERSSGSPHAPSQHHGAPRCQPNRQSG